MDEINKILDEVFGIDADSNVTLTVDATIQSAAAHSNPARTLPLPAGTKGDDVPVSERRHEQLLLPASVVRYFHRIPGSWTVEGKDDVMERPISETRVADSDSRRPLITLADFIKSYCRYYSIQRLPDINITAVNLFTNNGLTGWRRYLYEIWTPMVEYLNRIMKFYFIKRVYPVFNEDGNVTVSAGTSTHTTLEVELGKLPISQ